jgi:hypothetical protein
MLVRFSENGLLLLVQCSWFCRKRKWNFVEREAAVAVAVEVSEDGRQ